MGNVFSGGSYRQAGTDDLELHEQLRRQQRHHLVPLLQRHDHPHEYLFFALSEGAGRNVNNRQAAQESPRTVAQGHA